jgi:capsular exopolysaccharide synthesis family protein
MSDISSESLKIHTELADDLPPEVFEGEVALQAGPDTHLYSQRKDGSLGVEQLRMLQIRLLELQSQRAFKRLLITSANRGEGKTHFSTNLALTFASEGHRVLLIDADVRNPSVHLACGIPNSYGLKDWLHEGGNPWRAVRKIKRKNLYVITGGTAASESFRSSSIAQLQIMLDAFAPAFDLIVLDSAPLLGVVDTKLVSSLADAVLLVVRAGATSREQVLQAQEILEGQNIVGTVLNRVDPNLPCFSSYYQYSSLGQPTPAKDGGGSLSIRADRR